MRKLSLCVLGLTLLTSCGISPHPTNQKLVGIISPEKTLSTQEKSVVTPKKQLPSPSFSALPSCNWSRTDGFGVAFWSQKCDLGGMISDVIPGTKINEFVMEYGSGGTMNQGQMVARVFITGGNNESVMSSLKLEKALGNQYECSLVPDEPIEGSGGSIIRYSLAPKKQEDIIKIKEQMKTMSGVYPCGKYGINSDETNYFIQPAESTGILLYVNFQTGSPLIDEDSIIVE